MRLSMMLSYAGGFREAATEVVELEKAGLDIVWVPEAYSFDAATQMGYLAAVTERVEIASGILNVYSRSAALVAMTFAGLDHLTDGRAICGLGASGPQVIEGFHGIPYEQPMQRIREYIDVCRSVWRREPILHDGKVLQIPLPPERGTGLGKPLKLINRPVRSNIPVWWASLMAKSVEATAEVADGWLPTMFLPEKAKLVWGDALRAGAARRSSELQPLEIAAGGLLAIDEGLRGDAQRRVLDRARPGVALYVGGMGARDKNFYNAIARQMGFEAAAADIQDLYLDGKKEEAAARVPLEWLEQANLVGPAGLVKERVAAFREAGVTVLQVQPVGQDVVRQIEELRTIVDAD